MNTETGQSVPQDMSTEGVPEVEQEPKRDWFFTFGAGQRHDGRYVVIHGTEVDARAEMVAHFGNRWCDQYRTAERAGIDEYDLIVLPRAFWPEPTVAAPTSFEEQVAVHVRRLDAERTPVAAVEERTEEQAGEAVAWVPQRAMDYATGLPLRMHMPCGRIVPESRSACRSCDEAGDWRALYVRGEQR